MARYLVFLAVVTCCIPLSNFVHGIPFNISEDAHNVYQCPDPTTAADTPLCRVTVEESGHLFVTTTKTVKCPETGINKLKLACIMATNLDDDHGGYATIENGGLDDYYVDFHLTSQWSRGLNFHIEVYTVTAVATTTP